MLDCLIDALLDSLKLLPYLFIAYLLVEYCEHKASSKLESKLSKIGRFGPVAGAIFGTVPQCGFCVASVELYRGGLITFGTMLSVMIATSDEALPILLAGGAPLKDVITLLGVKAVAAVAVGLGVDIILKRRRDRDEGHDEIHSSCHGHCCEHGIFRTALSHSARGFVLIFATMAALNLLLFWVGEETLTALLSGNSFLVLLGSTLFGLLPGCAPSILLSELFLEGAIDFGCLTAGLITNTGLGYLALLRSKVSGREKSASLAIMLVLSMICGLVF